MAILLKLLDFLFGWAIKAWMLRGPSRLETVNEQLGETKTALAQQVKVNTDVAQAETARNSTNDLTIDELPKHTPKNDPDFRD